MVATTKTDRTDSQSKQRRVEITPHKGRFTKELQEHIDAGGSITSYADYISDQETVKDLKC